jgi:hypothetical protein
MISLPDYILYALAFWKFLAVPNIFDEDFDNNYYNSVYCGYYGCYWLERLLDLEVGVSPTSQVRPSVRHAIFINFKIKQYKKQVASSGVRLVSKFIKFVEKC